jgi:hypothetical protein
MSIPWIYFIQEDEQLLVESPTGRKVVNGPGRYISRPLERITRREGLRLNPTEYARLVNRLTGNLRIIQGPQLYFLSAHEEVETQDEALALQENQYAYILDTATGQIRSLAGPTLYVPEATERIDSTHDTLPLRENQYIRILNNTTGQVRVIRGEANVMIEPHEKLLDPVKNGINIDDDTAVLVRDITTGQQTLITEPQVFVPSARQEIIKVRDRIRLEDHEVVIVKDRDGRYSFRKGSDEENRSFFLEPHSKLVRLHWSSGIHKDKRDLVITHIDTRPKYMWYEFEVRTQDNVELVIGITFFTQIEDVQAMIRMTDDTPGDVCSHARSTIIQAVSKVTLEAFLADFNNLVRDAVLGDGEQSFYAERGVRIRAVEVRSIACKDPETQQILMEIIQETTNRLNRLQKQESENEVRVKELEGAIEAETSRGELLSTRRDHEVMKARTDGEAEAERVLRFFEGLGDGLSMEQKVSIFNMLQKREILDALSKGTASLYFTPSDVDLSIETQTT